MTKEGLSRGYDWHSFIGAMELEQARVIKAFRCDLGCTWRKVAELAAGVWPDDQLASGNQLCGVDLCNRAAELLGEDSSVEPWN